MKLLSIVGARPQFIKVKPLVDEFNKKGIQHILVHTGQHYDYEMSQVFFDQLKIPLPDYNLGVGSHSHGKQTGLMLEKIEEVLLKEMPDMVIVYGDTNSTLAGALSAVKLKIPVAHIEAGLRSFRMDMPEEANRVITDRISTILFCPTQTAVENLRKEGITKNVFLVGDVMYDVFLESQKLLSSRTILNDLNLKPKNYLLLTIHRQENTDNLENLKSIFLALKDVNQKVLFPVHPRTKKAIEKIADFEISELKNFQMIEPVSYLDMLVLEKNADKILTDSGGIQKEANWFGIPCLILRNETEWVELLVAGNAALTGSNQMVIKKILFEIDGRPLSNRPLVDSPQASERTVVKLLKWFETQEHNRGEKSGNPK
ncbi:MAG TPA: UDP-N-acetylglucosamine 2-epimerase (non-hydrolyzing) [bacterium]|nr:UDP-N-acetylglucosamine 2-epimerase (non-hydrolyzing) [bacterium]HOL35466.1 UDP-N-acetylglucosamine 2-epimerase (non-hydrolyzing) [bacterium]HPP08864.1 UDP-N-acetylglucosamine 2-epimerase (non-hydrolyzing) [bacterium]HXK44641.1 UDP-N-acetylglucosamine 2-epimerase (non-hydrolyzing) [bacterium]